MPAFAVIDLVENIDVTLQAAQFLIRQACRVDESRLIILEAGNHRAVLRHGPILLPLISVHTFHSKIITME